VNERGGERIWTIHCSRENKSKIEKKSHKTGKNSPNTERKGPCPPSGAVRVLALKSNKNLK